MPVSFSLFAGAGYQFFDNSGTILSGGKLYVYAAGTTTQINTYSDISGTVLNSNPIILDSSGRVPNEIWVTSGTVSKFALNTSADTLIATWDNIPSLSAALNGTGVNNGIAYFNSVGELTSSANFTYNGSNASIAGGISIGTTANIISNATVGGTLAVTGAISSTTGISSSTPATTQAYNDSSTKIATTAFVKQYAPSAKIQSITASVLSNNLNVYLDPTYLDFRSSPTNSGTVQSINIASQLSLQVPNGITLGMTNNIPARLAVLAVYNGSTVQLAITNTLGKSLNETTLISTSTSASTTADIYSSSILSQVPYRIVGYIEITCATAGVWTANPTYIQGAGGEALSVISSPLVGVNINYYTNTTTWDVPANVNKALVWCFGGAGGGYGGVSGNPYNQGRGGYGGYIAGLLTGISGTLSISVGAGGTVGFPGATGGTSSVTQGATTYISATGGTGGGSGGSPSANGTNGTGSLGAGVSRIRLLCGLEGTQSILNASSGTTYSPQSSSGYSAISLTGNAQVIYPQTTTFLQSGLTSGQGNTIWSTDYSEGPGTPFSTNGFSPYTSANGMGGAVIIQY